MKVGVKTNSIEEEGISTVSIVPETKEEAIKIHDLLVKQLAPEVFSHDFYGALFKAIFSSKVDYDGYI